MSSETHEKFCICPVCKIGYTLTNNDLFDHINNCDGRKDIITTRFYRIEELKRDSKIQKDPDICINPYLKRPNTR